ncbi:MAG: helix-turn-helix transcriptional regulator [Thermoleophilia bacterium]|nr:helix-turn-helix transcriptional regulator [Thermoleophilia bacterium]
MSRQPLPDELVELIAERFRLIGEPIRIRLLDRLSAGERSVGELAADLGATQQNVSKHLATLHKAGVLTRRKEGNRVVYSVADPSVLALCSTVCDGLRVQVAELARIVGA